MEKERSSRTLYCPLVGLGTKAWLVVPMRSQEVSEPSMELVHWADGRTTTKGLRVSYFYSELLHILQKKKISEVWHTKKRTIDSIQFRCPSRIPS